MNKRLLSFFAVYFFFVILLLIIPDVVSSKKAIIKKGDYFPELLLNTPVEPTHVSYLGLEKGKKFTLRDITADMILVEIMNINCSSCQKQAPVNNKLFSLIESTAETKDRIKMLAVAVGCLDVHIKQFVEHFNTPYPIIQDPKFIVHDAIGGGPIPLAILIRREPKTGKSLVAWTHSGFDSDYEGMFYEIKRLMSADLAIIKEEGKTIQPKVVEVKSILSDRELQEKIELAFAKEGRRVSESNKIDLQNGRKVYMSIVQQDMKKKYIFATMVSRPSPCDVCHDVHFIYVFDANGKILQLIPVLLTKYGNETWDDMDIEKMRKRVVGRYLQLPFDFDPKIDAVTSATITSSIIFKSLEEEQAVFKELKEKGLIPTQNESPDLADGDKERHP